MNPYLFPVYFQHIYIYKYIYVWTLYEALKGRICEAASTGKAIGWPTECQGGQLADRDLAALGLAGKPDHLTVNLPDFRISF